MATQQSGLVSGNSQNAPGGFTGRSRSKFPLSYSQFQTERFAEYTPFFVEEGVSGDVLPFHSNHEVQTYTLKSPILQSLSKNKDYFVVPMQAILPLNWEKFYTNPNIGQDVPSDCGLGVVNFWSKMRTLCINSWSQVYTILSDGSATQASKVSAVFRFLLFFENIYSAGSLMETLRISGHNWFKAIYTPSSGVNDEVVFDFIFDTFMSDVSTFIGSNTMIFTIGSTNYQVVPDGDVSQVTGGYQRVNLREALELMRDDLSFTFSGSTYTSLITAFTNQHQNFDLSVIPISDAPLNLGRLWAYQLVVSHFYSNDHIDFIYSADLFRQYIKQLVTGYSSGINSNNTDISFTFVVNGLSYEYDALSARYFNLLVNRFSPTAGILGLDGNVNINYPTLDEQYAYFVALFSFKRSLRFMDYFTGARAYPFSQIYGSGSPMVNVSSNQFSVIDLSRQSMMTKFLQAVNRSGRKFSAYMKELFGKTPAYDYHNPMYLAHTSDLVGAQETENTGQAQVTDQIAVTSRFRATSSRYAFEFQPDRDCIVLGISYYDLPRVYQQATDAQNFFLDRFDMFNPYLQFIGDQPISEAEIGTQTPDVSKPFAYTNKDMPYKQRYNSACGGFCVPSTQLDNWIFPADTLRRNFFHNISPSFIRSFNSEIDRFYQSLTGYSLGTYFHFIVRYDNRQDASRPMAYNPPISI